MQLSPQITFRGMRPSPAVEAHIRERVDELERFFGRIIACRVVIEANSRRQRQGNTYRLTIDLTVPGREIVVRRSPSEHQANEDILVAVRDAFDAARRQLADHARTTRGDVKRHEAPSHGRVVRLFPDYGFIRDRDGSEIYMHRNAVVGGVFDRLAEGDEVRFVLQEGDDATGPHASSVMPLGKHHPVP